MNPLLKMTDYELIDTTQQSELDYDIRIEASKEYLKRMGVIGDDRDGSGEGGTATTSQKEYDENSYSV